MSASLTARVIRILGVLSLLMAFVIVSPPTTANHTVDLTVRITRIADLGGGLDDNRADLYVAVVIDGEVFTSFNNIVDDLDTRQFTGGSAPNFTKAVQLTRTDDRKPLIPVQLTVWDNDSCDEPFCTDQIIELENDDKGDVNPGAGDDANLFVDPITGAVSGDASTPSGCINGGLGSNSAEVCWQISTDASDTDGDGLLNDWEINGLDTNDDGTPEVNLPAMGADPDVPDIFLELDFSAGRAPARDDIRAIKRAFAAAGINVWFDLGGLVDPTAREGQPENTCMDGIDNNGDGQTDGADADCDNITAPGVRSGEFLETSIEDSPGGNCADGIDNDGRNGADGADQSCLVGDFLGGPANWGGNLVPALNNCGVDAAFYLIKNGNTLVPGNFNPNRRLVFRYAISTIQDQDTDGNGPDTACTAGGQGEIGGNDFIDYNNDGGTIMHELGHNLFLGHGGANNDGSNCDPNHVSGMNYDLQFGIPRTGGGVILDYSPPRINVNGSTRGNAPLVNLVENSLDETVILDPTDGSNRFIFTNINPVSGNVQKNTVNLNVRPNWNGDSDAAGNPDTTDTGVIQNINDAGPPNASGNRRPAACINGLTNETLGGFDSWDSIVIPFLQYGDSLTQKINGDEDLNLPTIEDRNVMFEAINTADVRVTVADSPDPVGAGERLTYTVTANNFGPNPATSIQVTTTLPADVTFVDVSVPCERAGIVLTCNLGEILAGGSRTITIRVDVPADLVYANGGPKTITATASIDNLAGPDPNTANDTASADTLVVSKADLKITSVTTTSPLELLIGEPDNATIDITVENGGPSTPVDSSLTGVATPDPGLTVTPASATDDQAALAKDTPRDVTQTFSLTCTAPGNKMVQFDYTISNQDPTAIDPDLTNNTASVSFTVDCIVPIAINVRPGGFPNSINLNTDATLAALTTAAGEYGLPLAFNATTINPLSVRWGLKTNLFNVSTPSGAQEIHNKGHIERSYELDEKTRDADLDMVLHFKPSDSGLTVGTTESCLKGSFRASDGNTYRFLGCDSVRIVPK